MQVKSQEPLPAETLGERSWELDLAGESDAIAPALPIQSRRGGGSRSLTAERPSGFQRIPGSWTLWELAVHYESARGGISHEEVLERMGEIVRIMEGSVETGLAGTEYGDRILPAQSGSFRDRMDSGNSLGRRDAEPDDPLCDSAIMEVKSSMGVVVAAPTAGSCGALAGTVLAAGHALGASHEEVGRAMLAAGLIGVFITAGSTFAAEVCGCQAECGAGAGWPPQLW